MKYIEQNGLKGYVNEEGAWISPPSQIKEERKVISVNLPSFILSLPFSLQDELATYTQNNKLLEVIFNSGKTSKEDIVKLKERILYDYSKQAFSEELKNTMITTLDNLGN